MSSFVASDMETTLPSRGHLNLPPTPQRKSVALPTFPSVYNVFQTASGSSDQMSSEVSPIRYAKLCPVCGFKPPAELDIRRHIEQCFEQNKLVSIHYAPTELDQLKLICRASTDKTVMMKRDTGSLYKSMARLTLNNRLSIKEAFERLARQASVSEQERYGAKYNMASVSSEGPEEFHSFEYQAMLLCFKQGERCRQTPEEQNASAVAAAAAAIASASVQPQTQAIPAAAPLAAQSVSVHVSSPLVTPATPLAKALPVPAMPVSTASSASTDLAYSAAVAQSPSHQQVLKAMQESGNVMSTMGLPLPVMGTTVSASTSSPAAVATPALAFFSTSETQQQQDGSTSTMSVSRPANESETYFVRNTRRKLEPLVTSSTNGATATLTPSHSARPLPATPLSVTSAAVPAVTMASLPPSSTRASVVKSSPRASSVFTFQPLEPTPTVTAQYSPQTNSVTSSTQLLERERQENADLEAWRSDLKRRFVEMCDTRGPANNPPLKPHHAEEYNSPYLNLPSSGPSVSREFALALALQTGNAVPALTVKRPMDYTGSSGASESGYSVYSTSSVHCTAPTTTTATAGTDNSNATAWRGDAELNQNNNWINNSNSLHNNNTSRVARDLFNQQFSTQSQSQTGTRQQLTVTEADLSAKDWYAYPSPAFQLPPAYLQRSNAPSTVQSPLPSAPPAREPSYYPSMWLAERPSSSPMNDADMDSSAPSLSNSASFNSVSGFTANSSLNAFRMWPPQPQMGLAQSAGGGLFGLHSRSSFDPPLDFTSSF